MSCPFPPEILDLVVDHLHNKPKTLKMCCLVSKSWIPRTRKHLFAAITLYACFPDHTEQWKKNFPDPSNSPAHHTRRLSIHLPLSFEDAGAGFLLAFSSVVHLDLSTTTRYWSSCDQAISLVPLHGLSPVIKSLRLKFSELKDSEVFGLICSFPLLEDLDLSSFGFDRRDQKWSTPSTSPRLTGSLELWVHTGIQSIARGLLDLPNGLHFAKVTVHCYSDNCVKPTMGLVSGCSDTLESLDVTNLSFRGYFWTTSLDLSKAIKLRDLALRCEDPTVQWITKTLRTVESNDLQQITLELPGGPAIRKTSWETVQQEWLDLDCLLVQFAASCSLRLKIMDGSRMGREAMRDHVVRLLPELTERGIDDLVEFTPYKKI